uniref:Phospholipid/glycerol acyltransferase domain-containing protein n=1 Tax=Strigamia maritima TaxID=126957 RepID=T1JBV5_STRMM
MNMQCSELQTRSKLSIRTGICMINSYFRSFFPVVVLVGVVPQLYTMWLSWRVVSFCLPKWLYQRGDDAVFLIYQRIILYFFEHWVKAEILFYGDVEDVFKKREKVIYISNHQSTVDWIIVGMLAIRQGSEGNVRFIMKNQLQLIPMVGMYLYHHGCIYVRRGKFNPEKMMAGLEYLKNRDIPSWIVIFPEGTRYNPESKDLAEKNKQIAQSQGLQPLTHCSMPKSRGFHLMMEKMRNNIEYVYNATIIYEDAQEKGQRKRAPSMFEFMKLHKPRIHIHVERISVSSIPKGESDVKTWLNNAFTNTDSGSPPVNLS